MTPKYLLLEVLTSTRLTLFLIFANYIYLQVFKTYIMTNSISYFSTSNIYWNAPKNAPRSTMHPNTNPIKSTPSIPHTAQSSVQHLPLPQSVNLVATSWLIYEIIGYNVATLIAFFSCDFYPNSPIRKKRRITLRNWKGMKEEE